MSGDAIEVAELFAGVGGFRGGLEGWPDSDEETGFKVVWSNQWEPETGKQHAKDVYVDRWDYTASEEDPDVYLSETGVVFVNKDIHRFTDRVELAHDIPEHDLLVGGFPCQDYSVARTISGEMGIKGKKGELWEPIRKIIRNIHANGTRQRPKVVLLENVPRLLNSPADARGLNFAKILRDLLRMRYEVEWRVVNAADYGMPQQRSRVFILAYRTMGHGGGDEGSKINGPGHFGAPLFRGSKKPGPLSRWVFGDHSGSTRDDWAVGPFGEAFPAECESYRRMELPDVGHWSDKKSPFGSAGYAWEGRMGERRWVKQFCSWKAKPLKEEPGTIRSIMVEKDEEGYDPSYEIECEDELYEWVYAKSEKKEFRIRKEDRERAEAVEVPEWERNLWEIYRMCLGDPDSGGWDDFRDLFTEHLGDICYKYEEGQIAYPDLLDRPSRTVVTSEIGRSPSRMRHLIRLDDGTHRRLMPIELERLNMFPDGWTLIDGITDSRRGFLMGNALVVGVIERLREPIKMLIDRER